MARAKGSINLGRQTIMERVNAAGADPLTVLMEYVANKKSILRYDAAKELMPYIYTKRKSVEVDMNVDPELLEAMKAVASMTTDQLKKIIEEATK